MFGHTWWQFIQLKERCWARQTDLNWYSTILPYAPLLTFFFWARFVSVLFILAFYLLSDRDCWFWSADRWDCDTDILHLGNYDSPWNCLLGSHLARDPAGHFTAQLPFPTLLLVTLQSLILLLLLLEHLETTAAAQNLECARCKLGRRSCMYIHVLTCTY